MPAATLSREASRPNQDLQTAWLLLLLAGGESYGYDLSRRLADSWGTVDPSMVYRRLRALEARGYVGSRWARSADGPPRRVYAITGAGQRHLDELAECVRGARGDMGAFLRAHERRPAGSASSQR